MSDKGPQKAKNMYVGHSSAYGCHNSVQIEWVTHHKNLENFSYLCVFDNLFLKYSLETFNTQNAC